MNERIKVLDHGYVRYIAHMGGDETVIEAARMSTGKGFLGWEPRTCCIKCGLTVEQLDGYGARDNPCTEGEHRVVDTKGDVSLLEFLYKNQHLTPFEMCELHVEVYAPLFVFREWHRHRTFSYNEFSARYAQMPNEHYVPELERFRPVQSKNKQESSAPGAKDGGNVALWQEEVKNEQSVIYDNYDAMVSLGVPKEVARINTPVSRYSKMRAKTDLRNWLGFLKLRMASDAQWEIRQYADACAEIIKELWPRTWALFEEYTLYSVTLSRSERELFTRWNADKTDVQEFERLVAKIENF